MEALRPAATAPRDTPPPVTLREFCRTLLESGHLASKLEPPPEGLADSAPGPALRIPRPARDAEIAFVARAAKLPRPGALAAPEARAACLARFAQHELMAAELFAWALLRYPELPAALRAGLLGVLADEQRHCRMYVERLHELGSSLPDHPATDYFWRHEPALDASPAGPRAFLCAMGLTLEQANLDFAGVYADAFRKVGDETSAALCEQVHADEVGHVRLAAIWLPRLGGPAEPVAAYEAAVPFPLGAARAKGRRFDAKAREAAGLDATFIAHVRDARSTAELAGRGDG